MGPIGPNDWDTKTCIGFPAVFTPGKEWIIRLDLKNKEKIKEIVLVFLRAPEKGRVKTRLARKIGDIKALNLYKKFVQRTLVAVETSGLDHQICFFPAGKRVLVENFLGMNHIFLPQKGHDLGVRMANALSSAFEKGATKAILVGTDVPGIGAHHLLEALNILNVKDVVIGPSLDGGYWLIGFHRERFCPDLFCQVDWGSDTVFSTTIEKCRAAGLSPGILPALQDIDTLEDLLCFQENNPRV